MEISSSGMGAELYRSTGQTRKPIAKRIPGRPEVTKNPAKDSPVPPDANNRLDSIRDRMNQGFYNRKDVDDAISDKLSGAFDQLG